MPLPGDNGAQAPSQGGWDGIDDEFLDDPLNMRSGDRSVAPPTPGTKGDRAESVAPRRSLGQALVGQSPETAATNTQPATPISVTPEPKPSPAPVAPAPLDIARTAPRQPLTPAPTPDVPAPAMSGVLGGIDQSKLPDFVNGVRSEVPGRGAEEAIGRIPQPPVAANHADLVKQEADLSQPVDPRAVDPSTGKPKYRMGIGQRIIGTVANFANGFARNGVAPVYVGPGATNNRYATDVSQREQQLGGVEKQLGRQQQDTEESRKLYDSAIKSAYDQALGESRLQTAAATQEKADVASQIADIRGKAVSNQFEEAENKLEQLSKKAETDADLRQQMINNQGALIDLRRQLGERQLAQKQAELEAKYGAGATEKSLEDERKARLTAIENDWKEHPYWNKLTGNKTNEIKAVNDDINTRLQQLQGGTGVSPAPGTTRATPPAAAPAGPPKPQTHVFSRSAWAQANPKGNLQRAEEKAKLSGYKVVN